MVATSFIALLLLSVPIAFVLAITALIYIVVSDNLILLDSYPQQLFSGLENYGLLALPLFILLGECMSEGGIARRLMSSATALIGSVKGGLAYVNLLSNMMMASILGSTVAQITVMNRMAVPEMEKAGYPRDISVAITAAGGLLAPVIPPSMIFIIFGVIAQISIGDLFIAGIIPGVLMALGFFGLLGWQVKRFDYPKTAQLTLRERARAIVDGLPAGSIPVVVVGSILGGLATPTEAAALACIMSILIGKFVYREFVFSSLGPALIRAAKNSAMVLMLIAAAQVFSWVITFENLPAMTASWMQSVSGSPTVFLFLVTAALLLVGMILDPIPALILTVPVLLPIATDVYGINPYHFGLIVCLNLVVGLLTPPVGSALFTASALSGVRAERLSWLLLPYLMIVVLIVVLIILFPKIVTSII